MKNQEVQAYYNKFSKGFENDFVKGNQRVFCQIQFVESLLHADISRVLIIGCGYGDLVPYIRKKLGEEIEIYGVDIGDEGIAVAKRAFAKGNNHFLVEDITKNEISLSGKFDLIIFPDCYEHLPTSERPVVHQHLSKLLSDDGMVALTVPSLTKQADLRRRGEGLQIVDEDVSLEDCLQLATDVEGKLAYFSLKTAWKAGDYYHVLICRKRSEPDLLRVWFDLPLFHPSKTWFGSSGILEKRISPYRRLMRSIRIKKLKSA